MDDDELPRVMLSALQHYSYCPRQCALIHLDQQFADNLHTARGEAAHALVDMPGMEKRAGCRLERALPLFHDALGLIGVADMVEFQPDGSPYPVEYKHGSRHKRADIAACDDLQLAAQALCLEEMFGKPVPEGALYYASSRRRRIVTVNPELRAKTESTVAAVRQMLQAGEMPPPLNDDHCRACSLRDLCQPEALAPTPEHAAATQTSPPTLYRQKATTPVAAVRSRISSSAAAIALRVSPTARWPQDPELTRRVALT